ncbi:MAG: RsmB/NOP family class I SAM-dependent RNA methyltransferase [Candidatus Thorarchaeota archaeon]|nr:RsmB/NOP family class I SAM-dependent RNA methyltransferase [Candidatus Thorarchaeota archaeon]
MSRKEMRQKAKQIAKEHGYLQYMIERYLTLWGEEETLEFLNACEVPIRTAVRLNELKNSPEETVTALETKGIRLERVPWLRTGYYADFEGYSPGATLEHMLGYYYVQGVPSMTVVEALDPQQDEVVLDLASAPGGKTTHISQLMKNTGLVLSVETDRLRIQSLQSNILRCGATNTLVLRGDAKRIENINVEPDRILLDAPCSGEGLIPLDPSRKTSKTMADIHYCATREVELLDAAVRKLKPEGHLVYSTCSIAPEENEYIIDGILRDHPEMHIVPIDLEFGSPGYATPYGASLDESLTLARRFLPHLHGTEGFFICKMKKER